MNGFGVLNVPPSFAEGNPSSIEGNLNVTDPSAKYGQFGSPSLMPSLPPPIYSQYINGGAPRREEEWSHGGRHKNEAMDIWGNNGGMEKLGRNVQRNNGVMDGIGGIIQRNNGGREGIGGTIQRNNGGREGFQGEVLEGQKDLGATYMELEFQVATLP